MHWDLLILTNRTRDYNRIDIVFINKRVKLLGWLDIMQYRLVVTC